jgi:hypothetical protein
MELRGMKFSLVDVSCAIGITVLWVAFAVYIIGCMINGELSL